MPYYSVPGESRLIAMAFDTYCSNQSRFSVAQATPTKEPTMIGPCGLEACDCGHEIERLRKINTALLAACKAAHGYVHQCAAMSPALSADEIYRVAYVVRDAIALTEKG